ncbi:hypothetical protein [Undibacterium sp. Tian12W]|jgi:hypothetical protein|uniref:hypothetical protein n=1 Tax=Undibacterium sp. Tian12W TaxID=3413054 RepID=UPI003BF07135
MKFNLRRRDLYAVSIVSFADVIISACLGRLLPALAFAVLALVFFFWARKA